MEKIKIVYGYFSDEDECKETQKIVNTWLKKNPEFKIKNISSCYDAEEYILTIHYSDSDNLLP